MSQLWIVIPLVIVAALYVVWMLAPRSWRQRLGFRTRSSAVAGKGSATGTGCGCGKGDGGCH